MINGWNSLKNDLYNLLSPNGRSVLNWHVEGNSCLFRGLGNHARGEVIYRIGKVRIVGLKECTLKKFDLEKREI